MFDNKFLTGSYKWIKEIGDGGMGVVHLIRDIRTNKEVALKTIKIEHVNDLKLKKRFCREVRAMASLEHPNIIRLFTFDVESEMPWYIMDYCKKGVLSKVIKSLDACKALEFFIQACKGIEHAHSNNILHRDIKPWNMLIGNDGLLKISDFGLSMFVNRDSTPITSSKTGLGTIGFMSPEQLAGAKYVTAASDIYSLGATFYYVLVGELPGSLLRPPLLVKGFNKDEEDYIFALLYKCLERDVNKRPKYLEELIQGLGQLCLEVQGNPNNPDADSLVQHILEINERINEDHLSLLRRVKNHQQKLFGEHRPSKENDLLNFLKEEGLINMTLDTPFALETPIITDIAITSLGLAVIRFNDQ